MVIKPNEAIKAHGIPSFDLFFETIINPPTLEANFVLNSSQVALQLGAEKVGGDTSLKRLAEPP